MNPFQRAKHEEMCEQSREKYDYNRHENDSSAAYITALPLDTYRNDKRLVSSRRNLLLNSQHFCRSIPTGAENPLLSRLSWGWAYYLDAFSSYPLRTWLPSVCRGHDNWYPICASFLVLSY
ncbi:hypothetical protein R6Q57_018463 [Mikania cordata]